jgi:tRNA nucleotidyltransferase/poly(A) polymerase
MIRIALKNGLTFDFSRPLGTLKEDLLKRDYTINAIAWSPEKEIVDFYNGLEDIKKKKIRSISNENLISDPLRMLRAYRFAAEFNGSIEKRTRKAIELLHNNIKGISSERITLELFNLLNSNHSVKYLKMALSDGLLNDILFLSYKVLARNIKVISLVEEANINKLPPGIKVLLNKIFSQNLTYKGLICLELLLQNDLTMPERVPNIKMSSAIRKRIELAQRGIKEFKETKYKSKNKLYDIFQTSKEATTDILVIAGRLDLLKEYARFKRIWKKGFLSSEEIINISGIKTGPALGRIIIEIKKAQFEVRVKSKKSAIKFIRNLRC